MKQAGIIWAFLFFILLAFPVQAALLNTVKTQEFTNNVNTVVQETEYNPNVTLEKIISNIIRLVLSLLGVIFLSLMFWAGNSWMQAAGNEEKVKKAQATIRNLLIGLVLVLVAYALSSGFSGLLTKVLLTK